VQDSLRRGACSALCTVCGVERTNVGGWVSAERKSHQREHHKTCSRGPCMSAGETSGRGHSAGRGQQGGCSILGTAHTWRVNAPVSQPTCIRSR
jgi:hypothetical protein